MSPRTIIALTAEPGSRGSGCFSLLAEPTPITGTIPAVAKLEANCLSASSEKPRGEAGAGGAEGGVGGGGVGGGGGGGGGRGGGGGGGGGRGGWFGVAN